MAFSGVIVLLSAFWMYIAVMYILQPVKDLSEIIYTSTMLVVVGLVIIVLNTRVLT